MYKKCDILFLLFKYNIYICNRNMTTLKVDKPKREQVILVFNL